MNPPPVAPKPKISQQRIARDLGLSQALVSMVLNGRTDGISEDSYRRIWEHALSLGYQPKGMRPASAEASGQRRIHVGFFLRSGLTLHTQSNYYSHIQHGLHEALQEHGLSTVFLGTEDRLGTDEAFKFSGQVRQSLFGVVVLGQVAHPFLKRIKALCPRVVAASISYPGQCHSVQSNENQSLDLIVQHLASLGHRRIAWFGGNRRLARHTERHQAFQAALHHHQLAIQDKWTFIAEDADRNEGRQVAAEFLARRGPRPSAVVCYNGLMARGAVNHFLSKGLAIPDDLSLAAIDATRICTEENPFITGASADPELMGHKTAELLLNATGQPDEIYLDAALPSTLAIRQTTAPLRA